MPMANQALAESENALFIVMINQHSTGYVYIWALCRDAATPEYLRRGEIKGDAVVGLGFLGGGADEGVGVVEQAPVGGAGVGGAHLDVVAHHGVTHEGIGTGIGGAGEDDGVAGNFGGGDGNPLAGRAGDFKAAALTPLFN